MICQGKILTRVMLFYSGACLCCFPALLMRNFAVDLQKNSLSSQRNSLCMIEGKSFNDHNFGR
jgi:hypothetical protein